MMVTTTNEITGYRITETKGVVSWNGYLNIKGILGGAMLEKNINRGYAEIEKEAEYLGAHAVIGLRTTMANATNNEILILVYGTAVCIESEA